MTPIEKDHSKGLNGAVVEVLRGERAAQRKTLEEVARDADIPYRTLFRYFNAERAITMSVLDPVARALGMRPDEVLGQASDRLRRTASNVVAFPAAPKPPTAEDAHDGAQAAYVPKEQHESVEDDSDHAE